MRVKHHGLRGLHGPPRPAPSGKLNGLAEPPKALYVAFWLELDNAYWAGTSAAIARGCRHYSEKGELLATTLAVLECLHREGFVTVEEPGT